MNKEQVQKAGAGLVRVTGQDRRGDVYFSAHGNRVGVVRATKRGIMVLCGYRGRTDSYWSRKGGTYTKHSYPVYEIAVLCAASHKGCAAGLKAAVTFK